MQNPDLEMDLRLNTKSVKLRLFRWRSDCDFGTRGSDNRCSGERAMKTINHPDSYVGTPTLLVVHLLQDGTFSCKKDTEGETESWAGAWNGINPASGLHLTIPCVCVCVCDRKCGIRTPYPLVGLVHTALQIVVRLWCGWQVSSFPYSWKS